MNRNFKLDSGIRVFLILLFIVVYQSAWAEKTDVVYLKNGDRVTGELKNLKLGKLELLTDFMGTLYIEWVNVQKITSKMGQSVELTNGQRFYGALIESESDNTMVVSTRQGAAELDIDDVFAMYPVGSNFWEKLDVTADLGMGWDKGSEVGKFNLGLGAAYWRTDSVTKVSLITEITTQSTTSDTQRSFLGGLHNIFKPNNRFHSYFASLDSNDQLGIDLRALTGVGYGWVPVRSPKNWFSFALGLDINHEIPTTGESETNLEGVGWLTYEYYKFTTPDRTFTTNFRVFPGLTNWGRWRADLSTDFRVEIVTDFFWKLNFYANYDTDPVSINAAKSDYGVTSSLGYKF